MSMSPRMITIDCADPRALVPFWREATGYVVASDYGAFVVLAPPDEGGPAVLADPAGNQFCVAGG